MNKDNIFKSSKFFMYEGDVLHIIIKDESGTFPQIILAGEDTEDVPGAPTVDVETSVTSSSFSANWFSVENADGYYLDVSTDSAFEYLVDGFDDKDVGTVNTYSVTGLATGTVCYYRVRAYNDYGTSGNSGSQEVTTTAVSALVDLDGNEYETVRIGNQEWITSNLKVTQYADGSAIENIVNSVGKVYSDWSGSGFDTFVHTGLNITSAIQSELAHEAVYLTELSLQFDPNARVEIVISNFTLNSGGYPYLVYGDIQEGYLSSERITGDGTYYLTKSTQNQGPELGLFNFNPLVGTSTKFATNFSCDVTVRLIGWDLDTDGAYCWYDNDIANKDDYGALYNGYAVEVDPSDLKDLAYLERGGVQESGWRVPIEADFDELITYLGGEPLAGGALKEVGFDHWTTPNTGAGDAVGFKGFGSGYRDNGGSFEASINQFLILYGSDLSAVQMLYTTAIASLTVGTIPTYGLSVRLVRDFPSGDVTCDSTDITSDSLAVTCDME